MVELKILREQWLELVKLREVLGLNSDGEVLDHLIKMANTPKKSSGKRKKP